MAGPRLTQLFFAIFNTILAISVVSANAIFCGSVFESQVDHVLLGQVMVISLVANKFECQSKCIGKEGCQSFNIHRSDKSNGSYVCELSNETKQTKPGALKVKKGSTYYGSVQISCVDVSREQNGQAKSGQCHPGYSGGRCQSGPTGLHSYHPAHSCKEIRDKGYLKKDGEYWIDPEKNGNPLKVFCDMTTDGGGWLLISSIVIDNPLSQIKVKTSYHGINTTQMVLTKSAMNELRTHLDFTQIRFYCSKQQGRTFHVTTTANSTGEAVVQYLSGQTDVQPEACGSFVRMENDNALMSGLCHLWGLENGNYKVGKWGHVRDQDRLYIYPAFVYPGQRWHTTLTGHKFCDDGGAGGVGDFWKIFVR